MILNINNTPIHFALSEEFENLAEIIGDDEKTLRVLQEFQGMNLYFPQKVGKALFQQRLMEDFKELQKLPNLTITRIHAILAGKYHLSPRWIRELIDRGSAA